MKYDNSSVKLACFLAFAALAVTQGCSDDNNDKPDPTITIDTGGKSSGGSGGKGGSSTSSAGKNSAAGKDSAAGNDAAPDAGGAAPVGTDGGTGATTNSGDAGSGNTSTDGGSGPIEPPACTLPERGANDCYNCPTDNVLVEWLNRCVPSSNTVEFKNSERVPLLGSVAVDVSLPALP